MIQGKLLSYGSDLSEVFNIRKKVFVEELGISEDIEFDDTDMEAIHVLVFEEPSKVINNTIDQSKNAVATGRIVLNDNVCIISHIAVLKNYRNKAYGDFSVKMLLNKAFTSGVNKVILYSLSETVEFFKKIGFQIIETINIDCDQILFKMEIHSDDIIKLCKSCRT